jgi:dTDP-4-amino-4,6-dideoxygalactose transaminase
MNDITENERNQVIVRMAEKGISTNVHYKPLPLFTAYKNLGFDILQYPNSHSKYLNEITLPLHTLLTNDDIIYISETLNYIVKEFYRNH